MGTRRHRKKLRGGEAIREAMFHLQVDNLMKQNMKLTRDQAEDMVYATHVQRAVRQEVPPNVILGNLVQEGPGNMGYDKWSSEIKKYKNLIRPVELLAFQSRMIRTPYYKNTNNEGKQRLDFLFMKDVPDDGSFINKPIFDVPRATPEQQKQYALEDSRNKTWDWLGKVDDSIQAKANEELREKNMQDKALRAYNPAILPPRPSDDVTEQAERKFAEQKRVLAQQSANLPPTPTILGRVKNFFKRQGGRKSIRNNKMYGARRTRRRRGGDPFLSVKGETEAQTESRFQEWMKQKLAPKLTAQALRERKVAPLGHLKAPTTVAEIRKISGKSGAGRRRRRHTRRRR